ncbi:MAG: regulatory protein RecX [Thermaerobacter sp.]|nr:regulatory protein RecX [Thermaerobacter sp.]
MPTSATSTALRWLSQRSLTVHEVKLRLGQRGYPADEVNHALAELSRLGLLDDRPIADAVVRQSLERHEGPRHITSRLLSRGVSSEITESVMQSLMAEVNWLTIAEPLRQRYDISSPKGRARLMRHLAREGFPASVIYRIAGGERSDEGHGMDGN